MGYFRSEQSSHHADIEKSVRATLAQGGIPSIVFQRRKKLRHLIILVDDLATEIGRTNPIPDELRTGMQRLGVPVEFGRFSGNPALFSREDGQPAYLDDLEADRKAYLLLIFSEGLGLRDVHSHYTLESLARWPQVALVESVLRSIPKRSFSASGQKGYQSISRNRRGVNAGLYPLFD